MNTVVLLVRMPEYGERAVVQRIQVFGVRYSWDGIIVPFQEAGLHGGMEAREHFVIADPVDERSVGVGSSGCGVGRSSRMRCGGSGWNVGASVLRDLVEDFDVPLCELLVESIALVRRKRGVQSGQAPEDYHLEIEGSREVFQRIRFKYFLFECGLVKVVC